MRRHAVSLLVMLCSALAVGLAALWIDPTGRLRDVHWQPPAPRMPDFAGMLPALPVLMTADAGQFTETLARPLFSPSRRPPPPKPPVAAPVAPAAPPPLPPPDVLAKVQILGMYEGAKGGAIIARVDGKAKRLGLKDSIGDWTLSSIDGREVTFSRASESRVLSLAATRPSAENVAAKPLAPAAPSIAALPPPRPPQQSNTPSSCNPRDARCAAGDLRR